MGSAPVSFALIGDPQYADRDPCGERNYRSGHRLHRETILALNQIHDLDFVVSLGDLGDGFSREEIPLMLENLRLSAAPVRHVVGNHDYVQYSEAELLNLFGLNSMFYDFSVGKVRFIVLNGLDVSRFSPPGSARRRLAAEFRAAHPWLELREWDGMLSQSSREYLRERLESSRDAGELAVIFCHVPLWLDAGGENARMWDHQELLELLDGFDHLRGWFAGHYHPGGIALRNGVLHKTVRAICNSAVPTATVVRIYPDRIELEGIGEETNFTFHFQASSACIRGFAPPGSIVMADTGELAETAPDGTFSLTVVAPGIYSLKAVAEGKQDTFVPNLRAPAADVVIAMDDAPERHLVRGECGGPATLRITDSGMPVRWFDLAGTPFGGAEVTRPVWHEKSTSFWTRGPYAFSAAGRPEVREEPYWPELRERGWFKGDFHAHLVHGENIYRGNLPLFAFAARAEHYDWLWCSSRFANDGDITDYKRLAERLSDDRFLLRLNAEFPKNRRGHVGNLGVEPITLLTDTDGVTNFELARRYITSRGGVAIPVHPLYNDVIREENGRRYSWMTGKEVFLWLLCAPEMMPCLDLFYNADTPGASEFWYMLLNLGYRIGCCATSDSAFDVGRTPGDGRGATFVRMEALTEAALLQGLRERRTVTTWDGAVVLLEIDGHTSGDILAPDGARRRVLLSVYDRPGKRIDLKLIRNGLCVTTFSGTLPATGTLVFEQEIIERELCWYLAELREAGVPERIRSAASPIYFRDGRFREPEVLAAPARFSREFLDWMKFLTIDELTRVATLERFREFLSR